MTLLEHPATALPCAGSLAAALLVAGRSGTLLVLAVDEPGPARTAAVRAAVRRETRVEDWVGTEGDDVAVVLSVLPADLDAVADRLLSVAERVTGRPAAGGLSAARPDHSPAELLLRARAGLRVAWACGGSRVVRHP
ncbi:hypothetical protein SAMN03159343_0915 [Klenkia marina]|uniref:Uncharacterized protein n=1 Tax=Klenkia marina TaxID=1960309 RepID=A0A1G4XGG1_9ACTN|nr:hypothetical protein [Klenkia marina]SCX40235.1 hypothetical protein SAMN03159343_0915 [Klenkia marina]